MKRYIKSAISDIAAEPEDIKIEVAESTTSANVLLYLIDTSDPFSSVPQYAASNPNMPIEQLQELAKSGTVYARRGVAQNPNTPLDVLNALSHDPDDVVRVRIASRQDIPSGIINRLHNDSDWLVRKAAITNPILPESVLWGIVQQKNKRDDYEYVIISPNATSSMVSAMIDLAVSDELDYPFNWTLCNRIMYYPKLQYADLLRLADCGILNYPDLASSYVLKVLQDMPEGYDITEALKNIWESADYGTCTVIADSPDTPTEFLQYLYENITNERITNHVVANLNKRGIEL